MVTNKACAISRLVRDQGEHAQGSPDGAARTPGARQRHLVVPPLREPQPSAGEQDEVEHVGVGDAAAEAGARERRGRGGQFALLAPRADSAACSSMATASA
jgi:hypothetical protein